VFYDTTSTIVFGIFSAIFLIRFFFAVRNLPLNKKIKYVTTTPFLPEDKQNVSIIIAARNEEENLKKYLPAILNQRYENEFEVIVVLDSCIDNSKRVVLDFQRQYDNLYFTEVHQDKRFDKFKKLAILLGVKAAKYENLVFIDADCNPASDKWLQHIEGKFETHDLILGYGGFYPENTFTNKMQRYDNIYNTALFMTSALNGKPYMAVGRNMAYKKELFNIVGGFRNHYHLPSGNDDLFVQDVAKYAKTTICIHPEAFVYTKGSESLRDFFFKKIRHTSISGKYKFTTKILLGLDSFSRMFYLPLLFFSLSFLYIKNINLFEIVLYLGVVKILADLIFLKPVFDFFGEKKLFWWSMVANIFLPVFIGTGMIYGKLKKESLKNWL